jgi:hypothetical protein
MKIALPMSVALIAAVGAWSPAAAQVVELVPGVYTTPEISAKCQAYAAKMVQGGTTTDRSRQAVALACAKKLFAKTKRGAG